MLISKYILLFLVGIYDAVNLKPMCEYLIVSDSLKKDFLNCLKLNGLVFMGFQVIIYELFLWMTTGNDQNTAISIFGYIFNTIYYFILVIIYAVSLSLTSFWFGDIANKAMEIEKKIFQNSNIPEPANMSVEKRVTNEIKRLLIVIFFTIQISLLKLIPFYIGDMLNLLHLSFLYSVYCFEMKWGTSTDFMKNINYFEYNLAYFCGFGFFFAVPTIYLSFFMSTAIFLVLYPIFLLTSIRAAPPQIIDNLTIFQNLNSILNNKRKDVLIQDIPQQNIGIFFFSKNAISFIESMLENII